MEDVQNIMNEMENLDKEMAVELSTDEKEELASLVVADPNAIVLQAASCGSSDSRDISICCTTVIPNNLIVGNLDLSNVKFIYNPNCLTCTVKSCLYTVPCGVTVTLYNVEVVGCIPFAFSAQNAITGACGKDANNKTVDICCRGSVCVDRVICCRASREAAFNVCTSPNFQLNCVTNGITVSIAPAANTVTCTCSSGNATFTNCQDETYVRFTATLRLPSCPS